MAKDILRQHGSLFLSSRLKRIADRMQADAAQVLDMVGLEIQPSHIPLLLALDEKGPMSITELVQTLGVSQPAVTRIATALIDLKLVDAERSAADQRQKALSLTPDGRACIARARTELFPYVRASADDLCSGLSGSLLEQIDGLEAALGRNSLAMRVCERRKAVVATAPAALSIREYTDDLAPVFYDLGAEWIEGMFQLEENDRLILSDPRGRIVDPGGVVLFVETPDHGIIGTGALVKIREGVYEVTKMGVTAKARGLGAGEFVLQALLDRARTMEVKDLYLLTNRRCVAAVRLYEKSGFLHDEGIMREHGARYRRCDVAMRYPLEHRTRREDDPSSPFPSANRSRRNGTASP